MDKRLPLPVGTVLQNRYRIVRQLGHGGFGAVYEAVDDDLNLSFALKETFYAADEDLRQAFKREARMLARLSHEAFPRVTHYFTEGDGCFLVMELIYGDDLDKLLVKRGAPFEEKEVLEWADQILDALEDLHAGNIIHRDIKPSNLKLTARGKIKLLDFGIAKGAVEGETTILTTIGSLAAATLQYAPLEQVLKASPQYQMMLSVVSSDKVTEIMQCRTDATSDLYALAATLYHLLTRQLPADAPTRALAVWSGQTDRLIAAHETNTQIKREVSGVLLKAMSLERAGRYQTAREMRQALKESIKPPIEIKLEPILSVEPAPTEPTLFVKVLSEQETQPSPPVKVLSKEETQPSPRVKVLDEEETRPSSRPFKPKIKVPSPAKGNIPPSFASQKPDTTFLPVVIIGLIVFLTLGILGYLTFGNAGTSTADKNALTKNIPADAKYKLTQTFSGHTDPVNAVAFSPDGKTIVSGSSDKTIKLWDATNGALRQTLEDHKDIVNAVAFSPDGKMVASGSADKALKLWDVATGTLKQTLDGYSYSVDSVVFSPTGKTIASGNGDGTLKLWDVATATLRQTLVVQSDKVTSVAFSPVGITIASGSADKKIKLWDVATGKLKKTLVGHLYPVNAVAFSPNGKTIVSGGSDNIIKLWDAMNGALKQTIDGHFDPVYSVAFSPDGKTIASGANDRTIKLWDVASGTLKQTLNDHSDRVTSVAFSPDGRTIASGSADKTIKLWRVE